MLRRTFFGFAVVLAVATFLLASSGESYGGLFDGCCARTTYAPTFVAPAPACTSCAAPVVVQGYATAAPQLCNMPTTVYRALYAPSVGYTQTMYSPMTTTVGYAPAVAYAPVSTYRPLLGTYQTRLVPYTTNYLPVPAVSYATYYAPVYSSCSPCNTCSVCPSPCAGGCASGACGAPVTYESAGSSCSSCAGGAPAASNPPTTFAPNSQPAPSYSQPQSNPAAPQSTYQPQRTNRVETGAERPIPQPQQQYQQPQQQQPAPQQYQPAPQQPSGSLNSMPSPALNDPDARTAQRSSFTSAQVQFVARPTTSAASNDSGWQPARD